MNKILWKFLPIAVGLTFGFFICNPPELFRSLGWSGWLILPGCFVLLVFVFFPSFLFVRQIFRDVELVPVEGDLNRKDVRLLAERFLALGFKPVGAALKIPTSPTTIIGFVREDIAVSAVIIRTEAGFGKTTFAFLSSLGDDTKGLTTIREIASALSPRAPWSFCQVFPRREVEELFLEHLRGLEFLHGRGLKTCPISSETFREKELTGSQRQREYLRKEWVKNTVIFVWRYVSKISPYRGQIAQQKIAAEYIRQIAGVPAATAESIARQKIIADIQRLEEMPVTPIHSGTGIASFVISLAVGLVDFAVFIFVVIIAIVNEGTSERNSPIAIMIGMILMLGGLGYLIGLALGIKGLFEKHRKKVFAVLGIILNVLGLIILGGLIAI